MALLFAGQGHAAEAAKQPAAQDRSEAQRWEAVRARYPERLGAYDAVPYSPSYRPDVYQEYRPLLPKIERLRRRLVRLLLDSKRCTAIEQVRVDTAETVVNPDREHLVLWAECEGGKSYHVTGKQIRTGELPAAESEQTWSESTALNICMEIAQQNGRSDRKRQLIDHQASKGPDGQIEVTVIVQSKGDGQTTISRTVTCRFAPGDHPRVFIQ